jgi:hypothetical protein
MANALTRFGQYCRDLRSVHHKTMGDQADALGHDISYISLIETGAQTPSQSYVDQFQNWLKLDGRQAADLRRRTRASIIQFPSTKYVSKNSRSLRLCRKISEMNPSEIRNFRKKDDNGAKDDG